MPERDTSYNVHGVLHREPPVAAEDTLENRTCTSEFIEEYFVRAGGPAYCIYVPEDDNLSNFRYGVAYREGNGIDASTFFVTESLENLASSLESRRDYEDSLASEVRSLAVQGEYLALDGDFDGLLPGTEPFRAQEVSYKPGGVQWVIDGSGTQNIDLSESRDGLKATVGGTTVLETTEYDSFRTLESDPYRVQVF